MRGTCGTRKRGSPEGRVFCLGKPEQKYEREAKVRITRRKSFSSGTAGTKVCEGRVGLETADRPKEEFFVRESRDKSTRGTRGTRKRGSHEGRVFHPGQPGQKYAWDVKARIARRKSFSSKTAGTKVRVGGESADRPKERVFRPGQPGQKYVRDVWGGKVRVGGESADRPKEEFFIQDSRDKSTRGTRKRGLPEGRFFRSG
ncbi:hypothetical protein KI387_044030 [Taxus chinensis]|uniref:Uncharacterized protein n=1 Tax=Taxus chinensis TaxID=29808 RepID=A0AA38FYU4_TAXCH|nr:hypothetical protein KI387_044030 [Taxus chinensis]